MTIVLSSAQKQTVDACRAAFTSFGWSPIAISGLLAMALGESSLNAYAVGDHDAAFGLFQDHADRCDTIMRAIGIDVRKSNAAGQCRAVDWELRHTEKKAGDALRQALTPKEAATVLVKLFERPRDVAAAVAKRVPYAEFFADMLANPAKPLSDTAGTLLLPRLRWQGSPNHYDGENKPVRLVVLHDCEGSYAGSVNWFGQAKSKVSAHFVLKEDGTEATQCVAYADAAWHVCAFNRGSLGLEMGGYAKRGFAASELRTAANIVAYLLHKFDLPCRWAEHGEGQGYCRHYDLGQAGGGHYDPVTDAKGWAAIMNQVEAAYALPAPKTWSGER